MLHCCFYWHLVSFYFQLLESLSLLRDARVIHCDLKPENILLTRRYVLNLSCNLLFCGLHMMFDYLCCLWFSSPWSIESLSLMRIFLPLIFLFCCLDHSSFQAAEIKLIDFGSACKEDQTVYTYIQVITEWNAISFYGLCKYVNHTASIVQVFIKLVASEEQGKSASLREGFECQVDIKLQLSSFSFSFLYIPKPVIINPN